MVYDIDYVHHVGNDEGLWKSPRFLNKYAVMSLR